MAESLSTEHPLSPPCSQDYKSMVRTFIATYFAWLRDPQSNFLKLFNKDSQFSLGLNFDPSPQFFRGNEELKLLIDSNKFRNSKVKVRNVDVQVSYNASLIIMLIGDIQFENEEMLTLVQTFFLARCESGYIVLNNICRIIETEILAKPARPVKEEARAPKLTSEESLSATKQDKKPVTEQISTGNGSWAEKTKIGMNLFPKNGDLSMPRNVRPTAPKEYSQTTDTRRPPRAKITNDFGRPEDKAATKPHYIPKRFPPIKKPGNTRYLCEDKNHKFIFENSLYYRNLTDTTQINDVVAAFSKFGPVAYAEIHLNQVTGVVEFFDPLALASALEAKSVMINDSQVIIEERKTIFPNERMNKRSTKPKGKKHNYEAAENPNSINVHDG